MKPGMPKQERGIEWYLTPSGDKRYRVRWWDGKKHRSRSFSRLKDARSFYTEARSAAERHQRLSYAATQKLTLAEFVLKTWAPRAQKRLASSTWKINSHIYNKYILHQLGARRLAEIDSEDLVEWQTELEEQGVGNPTQIKAFGILSSIFKEAARRPRMTGVQTNPVALLEKPSAKRRRGAKVFSPKTIEAVRRQLLLNSKHQGKGREKEALRDATLLSVLYMTGVRPGEALALKVGSLNGNVAITASVSDGVLVDQTKTGKDRLVPIRPALRDDLSMLISELGLRKGDLLFARKDGTPWTTSDWRNWRQRHFNPAVEAVGDDELQGVRPYDLGRHSHSALMLASGMSLPRLSEIQGHSIRILSEVYAAPLAEYANKPAINPDLEIAAARGQVFGPLNPSNGR